jgi:hypothetical protein
MTTENTQTTETETTQAGRENEAGKQLTLHEAQVQACMCMNRILYLTQDPEIKSFFVSYVAGFSDFDAGYKELVQGLLTEIAPTVGMQISKPDIAPAPIAWAFEATNNVEQTKAEEVSEVVESNAPALRP